MLRNSMNMKMNPNKKFGMLDTGQNVRRRFGIYD